MWEKEGKEAKESRKGKVTKEKGKGTRVETEKKILVD